MRFNGTTVPDGHSNTYNSDEVYRVDSSDDSSGGGGSSDFSTAEVTFASVIDKYEATVIGVHADCIKSKSYFVIPGAPVTVTVPLYKGKNLLSLLSLGMVDESYLPTTEGSIVLDLDTFSFVVTGNGTITAQGVHVD